MAELLLLAVVTAVSVGVIGAVMGVGDNLMKSKESLGVAVAA